MRQHSRSLLCALLIFIAAAAAAQDVTFVRDDYPSAAGARGMVAADFNRDGWADAAHANLDSGSVSVLLNARGVRLALAATIPVGTGPFDLAAADFNGDGIPDLAVANADADSISVLLVRGDGRFTRAVDIAATLGVQSGSRQSSASPATEIQ